MGHDLIAGSAKLLAFAVVGNRDDIGRVDLDDHDLAVASSERGCVFQRAGVETIRTTVVGIVVHVAPLDAQHRADRVAELAGVVVGVVGLNRLVGKEVTVLANGVEIEINGFIRDFVRNTVKAMAVPLRGVDVEIKTVELTLLLRF